MRLWLIVAGLSGALGVAFGAYAAHGFEAGSYEASIAEKASHYAIWHALALLAANQLAVDGRRLGHVSAFLFSLGVLFFSGSLAIKALTGDLTWPLITPVGGFAFIGGWIFLAVAAFQK